MTLSFGELTSKESLKFMHIIFILSVEKKILLEPIISNRVSFILSYHLNIKITKAFVEKTSKVVYFKIESSLRSLKKITNIKLL